MKYSPVSPTLLSTYSSTCCRPISTISGLLVMQKEQVQLFVFLFFWAKGLMLALHLAQSAGLALMVGASGRKGEKK